MRSQATTVELYGTIAKVTRYAVLFRCTLPQPEEAAQAAAGHRLWFPQRRVYRRVASDGRTVLVVPADALAQRVAQLPRVPPAHDRWDDKEEAIA